MAAELEWEAWPGFAAHVTQQMEEHPWPGNVRELRNVVERAVYRWGGWDEPVGHVQFDPFDSPWTPVASPIAAPAQGDPAIPNANGGGGAASFDGIDDLRGAVDAHEKAIVLHHLGANRWNQRQTAKALGLTYDQLRHCIRKHALSDDDA
jgi:psp operon transcriptional activator